MHRLTRTCSWAIPVFVAVLNIGARQIRNAAALNFNCPTDNSGNTFVTWASELGVTYHVQVTAVQSNFAGTTTLTFSGSIDPVVTEVQGAYGRDVRCARRSATRR